MKFVQVIGGVFAFCGAAFGAALPPGNWYEPVHAALQRAIDRRAGDPDAYAVFDFDNTIPIGDGEQVSLGYVIDNLLFAFSPDEAPAIFLDGVPDPDRPIEPGHPTATTRNVVLDCADLHRELLALAARQPLAEVRKTDAFAAFAAKVRYLRKRISRTFGDAFGYPWNKRFYCRMTPAQYRATMHAALDEAFADGRFIRGIWRTPASRPGRAGCVELPMLRGFCIPQEVKDLIRTLQKSGVDVYIVSGSFLDAIVPSVDGRYGVDIPEANVYAIHCTPSTCRRTRRGVLRAGPTTVSRSRGRRASRTSSASTSRFGTTARARCSWRATPTATTRC